MKSSENYTAKNNCHGVEYWSVENCSHIGYSTWQRFASSIKKNEPWNLAQIGKSLALKKLKVGAIGSRRGSSSKDYSVLPVIAMHKEISRAANGSKIFRNQTRRQEISDSSRDLERLEHYDEASVEFGLIQLLEAWECKIRCSVPSMHKFLYAVIPILAEEEFLARALIKVQDTGFKIVDAGDKIVMVCFSIFIVRKSYAELITYNLLLTHLLFFVCIIAQNWIKQQSL